MLKREQAANAITVLRMLTGILLFFCTPYTLLFTLVYLMSGFSDMVDGAVARKLNIATEFGARLDTIADILFVAVCLWKLVPVIELPRWILIWVLVIAVIKFINIISGFVVTGHFVSVHSKENKVTGILLFILPLILNVCPVVWLAAPICVIATFAAIREGHVIRTGKK